MITRAEAEGMATKWVRDSAQPGMALTAAVHEFDLGYVVWAQPPPDQPALFGAGRGIIDRQTGELSVWPSLPVDMVVKQFRLKRTGRPPRMWTWDPADQLRWDLGHVATPTRVTHLLLAERTVITRSVKGDAEPHHHPLVHEFLYEELPPEYRERGYDRCSEAAALSDALHLEDAYRSAAGLPSIMLAEARDALFSGAGMATYRVLEPGDPMAGETSPPCLSCAMLGIHFGFQLSAPETEA